MFNKIVLSIIIAIAVAIGCVVVGSLLVAVNVPLASTLGSLLERFATAFGILSGLWYFFTH